MKRNFSRRLSDSSRQLLPQFVFLIVVILNIITTFYVTAHYIDSDASSELVLAKHWVDTGSILSQDWIYGSELRILHMQLIFAPLMHFFTDWQQVRLIGTLILQAIYILSFAFLASKAGFSKQQFFYTATLLLLPISVSYGRIVLYHCHYLPNISLSFFLLGIVFHFQEKQNWRSLTPYFYLGLLMFFSFLGGLNSLRQLMITHIPMLFSIFMFCILEDVKSETPEVTVFFTKEKLRLLLPALAAAGASFIGLKCNALLLNNYCSSIIQPSQNNLGFLSPTAIDSLLYGLFHQFGFRKDVTVFSLTGILSLTSLITCSYSLWTSLRYVIRHHKGADLRQAICCTFLFYYTVTMLLVFLVITSSNYYPLYLSLCWPWAAMTLILSAKEIPKNVHPLHIRRLLPWFTIIALLLNGLSNQTFFNGSKLFDQPYEGLWFQRLDKKEELQNSIAFLQENGYDLGYAPYWEANIVTEITNGEISIISITPMVDENITYYDGLTSMYLREIPNEKAFFLVANDARHLFEGSDSVGFCKLVYEDSWHCIYDIVDKQAFINTLYS